LWKTLDNQMNGFPVSLGAALSGKCELMGF
jgi:hypothetical protein